MKWCLVLGVEPVRTSRFDVAMRDNRVAEAHLAVRKGTGGRQLCFIAGKSWIGEEGALAMPISMDLCSTEDHGYHLAE